MKKSKYFLAGCFLVLMLAACNNKGQTKISADSSSLRDVSFFLKRLRTLDHLPQLENSHTAMSSTWDTLGGNNDGLIFKNIKGAYNILLDTSGPGCIHRIFTGVTFGSGTITAAGTNIQIFIDKNATPLIDMPVTEFIDPVTGPFPYPFTFIKTYPGCLMPIPYSKHIRIQLFNPLETNWGNYWQITYTTYPKDTRIRSLKLPLDSVEKEEFKKTADCWLASEKKAAETFDHPDFDESFTIKPEETKVINFPGAAVWRGMKIQVTPDTAEAWQEVRFSAEWDQSGLKSVDLPLGYFFGSADYGLKFKYSSLLSGIDESGAWTLLPMPFRHHAKLAFFNGSNMEVTINLRLIIDQATAVPDDFGYLHATWNEVKPVGEEYDRLPRFGRSQKPFLVLLDRENATGKYIGTLMHVAWPMESWWWGEGDWLFWTDEHGFPPSYHGTGSEEYFNSGWCFFDRKAMSGYIKMQPGNVNLYSYHINDHFQFQNNIKTAVEISWWEQENIPASIYGSTAFWYGKVPYDAQSRKDLIKPRLKHNGSIPREMGRY